MDAEDEQILSLFRNSQSQDDLASISDESWAAFASFGPRCNRCGNPCGDDVVYHGSMAFHRRHFTCKGCNSTLIVPIAINNELYCQSCAPHVQPESHSCCVCHQPRNPASVIAAGRCFCREHFKCKTCGSILDLDTFRQRGGDFFCREHVPNPPASHICAKCHREVTERKVIVFGKTYHPDCFSCAQCLAPLDHKKYTTYQDKPICIDCFNNLPKSVQAGLAKTARGV